MKSSTNKISFRPEAQFSLGQPVDVRLRFDQTDFCRNDDFVEYICDPPFVDERLAQIRPVVAK